jgi:hypothetical protein
VLDVISTWGRKFLCRKKRAWAGIPDPDPVAFTVHHKPQYFSKFPSMNLE